MAIEADPNSYVGSLLWLRPTYGWGWVRLDDPEHAIDYSAINQGSDFGVRVQSFFSFKGELRGLVGRVEQVGHQFNDQWIVCGEMHSGTHDFDSRLCLRWDLDIGLSVRDAEWPEIAPGGPIIHGSGILALSSDHIDR
jgi:hypothetical protein